MALALLAPSAVVLGVFIVYPLVKAVFLGTQRCSADGSRCRDNGWGQYADVFRSTEFQNSLEVTAKFALMTVPLGIAFGVGLAVLAHKHLKGVGVFRTIFTSTVATSVAVASLMWLFLLQPSIGVIANLGFIGDLFPVVKEPGLLQDPGTALWSVAMSSVWANLGFTFIIVTAGLQSIPDDLYEAAALDGAGGTRRFWAITLPLLGPSLMFVLIVLTTRAFQAYGEIDLLTEGGPKPYDSTTTITYLTYGRNSVMATDPGLQATTAVLLFVVLLGLSTLQLWSIGRRLDRGD